MATHDIRRAANIDIKYNLREAFSWIGTITDQDSAAVDLSSEALVYSIRKKENSTAVATLTSAAGDITVSGDGDNIVTISADSISGITDRTYYHDLEGTTSNIQLFDGKLECSYTAYNT